jgi:succinoglycan biosynthesis transport protein ExoP
LAAIDQELSQLKAKLADLSSHYTDRYPDVLAVKQEIAKTEKIREDFIDLTPKKNKSEAKANDGIATRWTDLRRAPAMQLQGQLQANQLEISNREQSIAGLKAESTTTRRA